MPADSALEDKMSHGRHAKLSPIGDNADTCKSVINRADLFCKNYSLMRRSQNKLQHTIWAAIFALLVQALLPAMLYAAAPKHGHLAEICTAFGIKKIAIPDEGVADSPLQREHCPICNTIEPFVLPDSMLELRLSVLPIVHDVSPANGHAIPVAWLTPYLRGPPLNA